VNGAWCKAELPLVRSSNLSVVICVAGVVLIVITEMYSNVYLPLFSLPLCTVQVETTATL
jgi:hypothetical protein